MTTGRGPTEAVPADDLPTGQARAQYVRTLFDAIAQRYDLMNRLMTLGRDAAWRKIAAVGGHRAGNPDGARRGCRDR